MLYGEILYKWMYGKISVKEIHELVGKSITLKEAEDIMSTKQTEKAKISGKPGAAKKNK